MLDDDMYETVQVCHSIDLEEFDGPSEHDFIERNWLHIASGGILSNVRVQYLIQAG